MEIVSVTTTAFARPGTSGANGGSLAAPTKVDAAASGTPISASAPSAAAPQAGANPARLAVAAAAASVPVLSGTGASYSTTVGGKSYAATISQSNGVYTLSVGSLPGATVNAASLGSAEEALSIRIDTLV